MRVVNKGKTRQQSRQMLQIITILFLALTAQPIISKTTPRVEISTKPVITKPIASLPQTKIAAVAYAEAVNTPKPAPAPQVNMSHTELMAAAGIAESDWPYVEFIIQHESTWRPTARNPQGCIGLGQNCPQNGHYWLVDTCPNWENDPVCQLKRFSVYAGRYGGWYGSYVRWQQQGWW